MKTNESVVLTRDITPSLLAGLGIQTDRPYSLWNQTEEQQMERATLWNDFVIKNAQ